MTIEQDQSLESNLNEENARLKSAKSPASRLAPLILSIAALAGMCVDSSPQKAEPVNGSSAAAAIPQKNANGSQTAESAASSNSPEARNTADKLDFSIMPQVETGKVAYSFPLPANYPYSKDQLSASAQKLNDYVANEIRSTQQYMNYGSNDREKEITIMIENIYRHIQQDKVLAPFAAAEQRKADEDNFQFHARTIEKILIQIGQYFRAEKILSNDGRALMTLSMQPVEANETFSVKDKSGSMELPVLTIASSSEKGVSGIYDSDVDAATVNRNEIEQILSSGQEQMKQFGLLPSNFDSQKFRAEYIRDTKIHEATHAYLGKKFPKAGKINDAKARVNVNLNMVMDENTHFPIAGFYHPINFHELCAVGSELFNSNDDSYYSFMKYAHHSDGQGYELVNRLIVFYAIKRAPASPQKRKLEALMASNQPIDTMEVVRMIKATYTKKQVKEVGFKLYEIGFDLLGQVEKAY